ncbi:ACT domain-containing protein [Prevotella lacticifex]|nr:ACT domain-containing protein [Prevotella lacticifex]
MSGITDLQTLIGSMEPVLKPGEYVFCFPSHIPSRTFIA